MFGGHQIAKKKHKLIITRATKMKIENMKANLNIYHL